jgi:hypothetical protein
LQLVTTTYQSQNSKEWAIVDRILDECEIDGWQTSKESRSTKGILNLHAKVARQQHFPEAEPPACPNPTVNAEGTCAAPPNEAHRPVFLASFPELETPRHIRSTSAGASIEERKSARSAGTAIEKHMMRIQER